MCKCSQEIREEEQAWEKHRVTAEQRWIQHNFERCLELRCCSHSVSANFSFKLKYEIYAKNFVNDTTSGRAFHIIN
ncbi:hypothetical protein PUN28_002585 [Cardiocondyla obscurior]|uniref:Uncharacterized protein n=1 Tax=Cardiocondyla obscurior TaxID=286306 RepID=A0AAW2GUZ6_9HYME